MTGPNIVDTLKRLVAFPTVSGDTDAMAALLDYVESYLGRRGMYCQRLTSNGFDSLIASTLPGNKQPKVMLAAHADVVPGDPAMFSLIEEQGKLHGRGVMDMKFAIAAYMHLVDRLQNELEQYDFAIVITPDEEIGGRDGMGMLVEAGYRPQVCILPDGGDNWQVQSASKGYWAFDISATGKPAHGSRPWLGDNALTKLIKALDEIAALFPRHPGADTSTISLTRMSGGEAMNQTPGTATMTVDIRTIDEADHLRIYDAVQDICLKNNLNWEIISQSPPTSTDLAHPLIKPFVETIQSVTGITVTGWHAPAASDARFLAPLGIPFAAVYPPGGGHHTSDEWIDKQALSQFYEITLDYIVQTAKAKVSPMDLSDTGILTPAP